MTRNNEITLSATMIFSPYPQAYFPQLCITAIAVPGTEIGCIGDSGERFLDNQRIEGSISEMLDEAISFVKRNMKNKTIINPETGVREDRTDYPITAVREAIVNALVHRLCKALHNLCYAKLIVMQSYCRIHWFYRKSGSFYFA